ncbi:MAG: peptidoglycan-binding protein [Actinomycetota bacterium]|nr:peptidoglycan-binding protein [Actinomycetota bacterium]
METIGRHAAGPAVRDIQLRLVDLGYSCSDDEPAEFGPGTEAAVRAFQQQRGLTADGLVGPDTWRALVEAGRSLGDRRLYLTDPMLRGDDVKELQRRLNRLGFDAGYEDGVFGPQTAEAVRDFELNAGLRVDGIAGREVIEAVRRLHRQHQSAPAATVREREALRRAPRRPSLAGARILVDPGHGPDEPGFEGHGGVREHHISWQIANRLAGRLLARGVSVTLSRGPRTTPSKSERARLANDEQVDLILSIHLNGADSDAAHGTAAYYFGDGEFESEAGRELAELAVGAIVEQIGTLHCRCHPSASALLRESRAPAVIIEPGFLTHPQEGRRLEQPRFQDGIAEALTEAVTTFLTDQRAWAAAG